MHWAAWAPTLASIRQDFGYAEADDLAAAWLLHPLVPATNRWRDLGADVRNRRNLTIVGCGPSLEALGASALGGQVVVAADGACERLREVRVPPHLVVTDLDGDPESLQWAAAAGARMLVHAHGDNREALARLVPRLGPQVYGSHQVAPDPRLEPLQNAGGFTDGDRAVVLCEHLGGRQATLVGFDFDAPPSRYSHHWDPATKPRKLAVADRIVRDVHARGTLALRRWMP